MMMKIEITINPTGPAKPKAPPPVPPPIRRDGPPAPSPIRPNALESFKHGKEAGFIAGFFIGIFTGAALLTLLIYMNYNLN